MSEKLIFHYVPLKIDTIWPLFKQFTYRNLQFYYFLKNGINIWKRYWKPYSNNFGTLTYRSSHFATNQKCLIFSRASIELIIVVEPKKHISEKNTIRIFEKCLDYNKLWLFWGRGIFSTTLLFLILKKKFMAEILKKKLTKKAFFEQITIFLNL